MNNKRITVDSLERGAQEATGTVVIIDVFRAFTTAAIALANGAERIIIVGDLEAARSLRDKGVGRYCLGERGGVRPDGFDFGNSPAEILEVRFDGETVIQTTSNGTRGVLAATMAQRIYAGSFVSSEALVGILQNDAGNEISLIAIGNGVDRAEEDELCALYLRSRLLDLHPDPESVKKLIRTMSPRIDGKTLSDEDLDCCLDIGSVPFAIRVDKEDGYWVAKAESV